MSSINPIVASRAHRYLLEFSVNLGQLVPDIGKVLDEVHGHMADFGYADQHLALRAPLIQLTVENPTELSAAALHRIRDIALDELRKQFPRLQVGHFGTRELGD